MQSLQQLTELIKQLLVTINTNQPDNGITQELGKLITNALQDPITFDAAKELIKKLSLNEDVYNDLCILAAKVSAWLVYKMCVRMCVSVIR